MYRKTAYGMGLLFLGIFLFVPLTGCMMTTGMSTGSPPWSHGNRANHHYRYYPSHNVYFDEQQGVYFYLYDGRWQMSVSLPSYIRITVNDFVTLDMDTDKPYEYHNDVVKRYPPGQQRKKEQDTKKNKYQNTDRSKSQDKNQNKSQGIDRGRAQDKDQNKSQDIDRSKSQDKDQPKAQDIDKNKPQGKDKAKTRDKDKDKSKNKDEAPDKDQDNYQDKTEDNN
jgi:hypothetical protein